MMGIEEAMDGIYVPKARLPEGYIVTFSGTTQQELFEESESKTKIDHRWAWAADTDTEGEDEPEDEPFDLAVADHPAVAEPEADYDPDDVEDSAGPPGADSQVADSAVASPVARRTLHPKRRNGRLNPVSERAEKLYKRVVEDKVFNVDETRMPATPFGWTSDLRRIHYHKTDIPCRTCIHSVQMATYVLSKDASPFDLAKKLRKTRLQVIVIVFGSDVEQTDPIYAAIHRWADHASTYNESDPPAESAEEASSDLLKNKRVVALGPSGHMFAVLHEGKVRYAMFEARSLSCREDTFIGDNVHFGTLTVHLTKAATDKEAVRIGVILVRERLLEAQIKGLAQWIILHRLAVLTGFIGESQDYRDFKHGVAFETFTTIQDHWVNDGSPLTALAKQSGAIGGKPLYQMLNMSMMDDAERQWMFPVPFLFFGFYTKIQEPAVAARYYIDSESTVILSQDIERHLMHRVHMPSWAHRSDGNAYVNNLSTIKMPQVEWKKWILGCAETVVHFGKTQTENFGEQELEERRELEQLSKRRKIHSEGTDEEVSNGSSPHAFPRRPSRVLQ